MEMEKDPTLTLVRFKGAVGTGEDGESTGDVIVCTTLCH